MASARENLILTGGRVIDPLQDIDSAFDIVFGSGKVLEVRTNGKTSDAEQVVNVSGCLVVPGLIDFHTHVYWGGTALSIRADPLALRSGVTTFVDAGSAGAGNFHGFKEFIINQSKARILAFLHIVYPGIVTIGRENKKEFIVELTDPRLFNVGAALRVAKQFPDDIVGVKVRAGANSDGPTLDPVIHARMVAERIGKPLMVHIGGPPPLVEMILPLLRPGDIATHCFRPAPNGIVDDSGQPLKELQEALERGVLLDVGHGAGGFSFDVASSAIKHGILPHTISTDIHVSNIDGPVHDLPTTLNKFLALGMTLQEVIAAATVNPARAIGWDDRIGSLKQGYAADATILKLETNEMTVQDAVGEKRVARKTLTHIGTVIDGVYHSHSTGE